MKKQTVIMSKEMKELKIKTLSKFILDPIIPDITGPKNIPIAYTAWNIPIAEAW